ncbi:hypothetical protein UPYG_G00271320 [Umbra pygmaea]|uniref:SEFIR domain-containing protein n=1 Tax=Umbra pygmaea TaxID=75934 RepID=A0ABD0X1C1_UMBPY
MTLTVGFNTAQFSEEYEISIQNNMYSQSIRRENRTSLNVTFQLDVLQMPSCKMIIVFCSSVSFIKPIQPFFTRCTRNCLRHLKFFNSCLYYRRPPTYRRTFTIKALVGLTMLAVFFAYCLQRTLHTDAITPVSPSPKEELCGTEVVLDLLDTARLGVVGSVQWLDWQREQIEKSSDKILILCSRGVRAKWRAMCDASEAPVVLREDHQSLMGDMLTPALSLLMPSFVRSGSFQNYMVAYFDDVCSEEDVPTPFNITVRYKLMKTLMSSSSGSWIRRSTSEELQNPNWFEDELMKASELDVEVEEEPYLKCFPNSTVVPPTLTNDVTPSEGYQSRDAPTMGLCLWSLMFFSISTFIAISKAHAID